jgi:demethoxyubiquinone hydroxylase (CLK1/Coq7/Cat5 family)
VTRIERIVARARTSEIQAIAIYEAEVFWIRRPLRRAILLEILHEERTHEDDLRPWGPLGQVSLSLNRSAGWVIGSVLSILPWKWMCRVQAWAERAAAQIYSDALSEVLSATDDRSRIRALEDRLAHARDQELVHASRFQQRQILDR